MELEKIDNRRLAATGIAGLDRVLGGGLPRNRLYLFQGDPGVGKTTVGLEFLRAGAALGERTLYVTLSETKEELEAVAASHGWDLAGVSIHEAEPLESLVPEDNTLFHPSEVELGETTRAILEEVERTGPSRIVFDSLSEIRLLAQSPLRYRRQILALKQFFAGREATVILLDDGTSETGDLQLQSIAHGVVKLEQLSPLYGAERRRLRVVKLRGVRFRGGYHDIKIETGRVVVFPRLVAAEHHSDFLPETVPSGVPALDALLGGGIDRGTTTLILGPAGTGKSAICSQYAAAAAGRGERVAFFAFEEGAGTLYRRTTGLGIAFRSAVENDLIALQHFDPAELTPGEFSQRVREAVEAGARMVIIDSLNGYYSAMPEENFLSLQLFELFSYLRQLGVVVLVTLAQHGFSGQLGTPIDLSYLADTVIVLRYFETDGEIRKAISVPKKRSGVHETAIRDLLMDSRGIQIGEPLRHFRGILTGVPVPSGTPAPGAAGDLPGA